MHYHYTTSPRADRVMEANNIIIKPRGCSLFLGLFLFFAFSASLADAETHYHDFVVQQTPVKRLCRTHNIITVNGQLPGPTLEVRDGDTLVIKVVNSARYNVTLHWHGIRQMRTPWADGPEFVTQCPIQQEPPTLTGSQLKTRRGPYGGMLTANGLELLFMELLSSILNWVLLTPSHSPTTRPPSSLVTSSFS
ncbi:Laccase-13 [Vitis vinifera]|uniref:Laccase-13 n=1 Tax=Vitis vinifera TaxID=29760 RepID=A0A438KNK3_VITVI|nr:Laccase-13 [Vitis vinifera]